MSVKICCAGCGVLNMSQWSAGGWSEPWTICVLGAEFGRWGIGSWQTEARRHLAALFEKTLLRLVTHMCGAEYTVCIIARRYRLLFYFGIWSRWLSLLLLLLFTLCHWAELCIHRLLA